MTNGQPAVLDVGPLRCLTQRFVGRRAEINCHEDSPHRVHTKSLRSAVSKSNESRLCVLVTA